MQVIQLRCQRPSDEKVEDLLRDFVDVLLDSEDQLRDADESQWDRIVAGACRQRMVGTEELTSDRWPAADDRRVLGPA